MRIVCTTQHTPEWYNARLGKVTASRVCDAASRLYRKSKNGDKGDWSGRHWAYVKELAWERRLRVPFGHYVSKPMDQGTQFEPEARVEYWQRFGAEVTETGFILHPSMDYLGCSPDGLVGDDGGLELKVLQPHNFKACVDALTDGEDPIDDDYHWQIQTNLLCTQRKWWDWAVYCPPDMDPDIEDAMRLLRIRIYPDKSKHAEIEEAATATMEHVIARVEQVSHMWPAKGAPKSKFVAELERSVIAIDKAKEEMTDDPMSPGYAFLDEQEMVP